ncbi:MAG: hypothetical protein A2W90_04075 [Bacteroidetes bacterium GWF2_42_66]|nr:MAG: hypothetical protein A2W92_07870 [Bacteroidetes bacterium GWA2_42_15]OFY02500.1 MAG: hypothetical protein A2W89_21780 [Bacteroidetes bacterium GWE2_42_39]OFY41402.1 MAG: hypothetical protein A2W90_04075 [Bacteroidetes bacterium GWF2_42_66]HBL75394.1 hypothetical protein [Prolixibacteraceae bacterium]HCR90314.1 hypothetical protein [Prolixibacteraceae bacterium]
MINLKTINVLKGQHNIARGNAPGLGETKNVVREITLLNEQSLFRTKGRNCWMLKNSMAQFRPKEVLAFIIFVLRTVFLIFSIPGTLPRAEIYWPFRPIKLLA